MYIREMIMQYREKPGKLLVVRHLQGKSLFIQAHNHEKKRSNVALYQNRKSLTRRNFNGRRLTCWMAIKICAGFTIQASEAYISFYWAIK